MGPQLWGVGIWGQSGYRVINGIGPWGYIGYGIMGTDRYRAIKGIGPWGDTDMGWRAMGSCRIWGHKRYRAMGTTSMGPWGDTAMGCRTMGP